MRWHPDQAASPPADSPRQDSAAPTPAMSAGPHAQPPALPALQLDERPFARMGWLVLLLGVAGFVLWAAWAPLDKGVPAPGTVKVAGNRKAVQSPADGLVARILVREGDPVTSGQPLLRLDETPARTAAQAALIQLASIRASVARLEAERDGTALPAMPAELGALAGDARVQAALGLQRQLLASRRQALNSEIDAMREAVAGHEAELRGLQETQATRRQQESALLEQLGGLRTLAKDGYVTRNRLLDNERLLSQALGTLSEGSGQVGQLQRQIAELKLRIIQRREQYQAEVRTQLADSRLSAESLAERLAAAEHALRHTTITAPAAGTVVGLAVFTEGGYIRAGERLMDVVPTGRELVVEGQLPTHLIDKVHAGLPVELLFPAFNQNRTPRVAGRIRVVGADRLTDERSGMPYYPMEAEVTAEGLQALAGLNLRPGMPVEVFVRTGERSLLSYLFKPLLDRAHTALGEE